MTERIYYIALEAPSKFKGFTCTFIEGEGNPGVDEGDCVVRLHGEGQPKYYNIGWFWLRDIPKED